MRQSAATLSAASTRNTTPSTIPTLRRQASARSRTTINSAGASPNGWFDSAGCLAHCADVAAAGVNPLDHYLQFGIYGGGAVVNDGLWH